MVTNKTYGFQIGYMRTGKKAHLIREGNRPLCTARGTATRFLDETQGVTYEELCNECLQKRNKKVLGSSYTQMQKDMNRNIRQSSWDSSTQQDDILRRFR